MKKSLLLSLFGMAVIGANAQITITSADLAPAFKVIKQAHDTLPTVSVGSAGTSQTWNMTALNTHTLDTLDFLPAGYAPQAAKFPTATLSVHFHTNNAWAYLTNSASSATILGNSAVMDFGGGPSNIVQKDAPGEVLANWPTTYLTTNNSNFTTSGTFYVGISAGGFTVDSIRQKSINVKTSKVDAWGALTTPLGTFSTIRFYEKKIHTDTTWYFVGTLGGWQNSGIFAPQAAIDSSKNYSWWANGVGFPLVQANLDQVTMAITTVDWLQSLPTTGVNEIAMSLPVSVYPNPAQNEINIATDNTKVAFVQIYDVAGKLINVVQLSNNVTTINTSAYANGSYVYSVVGKNNEILNRGKFTIAK